MPGQYNPNDPESVARHAGFPNAATMLAFMQRRREAQNAQVVRTPSPTQVPAPPPAQANEGVFGRIVRALSGGG